MRVLSRILVLNILESTYKLAVWLHLFLYVIQPYFIYTPVREIKKNCLFIYYYNKN